MNELQTMLGHRGRSVCWLGNDGWLLSDGAHLIAIDLDLHLKERSHPPYEHLEELAGKLDFLLISHGHTDHFNPDTVRVLEKGGDCRFILPRSCQPQALEYGIDPARILFARPGDVLAPHPWLRVEATRALHGHIAHSVYSGASMLDCGYLIEFAGTRIFQPGDSVLLEEHLGLENIDLLFISPTEHNTHVEASLSMIEAIRPLRIFAQHFGSYHTTERNAFWTRGYHKELAEALPEDLRERYTIPEYGKVYTL